MSICAALEDVLQTGDIESFVHTVPSCDSTKTMQVALGFFLVNWTRLSSAAGSEVERSEEEIMATHRSLENLCRTLDALVMGLVSRGADVNALSIADGEVFNDVPALVCAALGKRPELMSFLLNNGADPLIESDSFGSAMTQAISLNDTTAVKILLQFRSDIGNVLLRNTNETPLIFAVKAGACDALRILLQYNVDLTASDDRQRSALHHAMIRGDPFTVGLLLAAGASAIQRDRDGNSPLHCCTHVTAAQVLMGEIEMSLFNFKTGRRTRHQQHPNDIDLQSLLTAQNRHGLTPFDMACRRKADPELISFLDPANSWFGFHVPSKKNAVLLIGGILLVSWLLTLQILSLSTVDVLYQVRAAINQ